MGADLLGGGCPYWQCMPSKALLHAASVHRAGGDFPLPKASDFRDGMINREDRDYPDDRSHERALRKAGAEPIRGTARFVRANPLRLEVARDGEGAEHLHMLLVAVFPPRIVSNHARAPGEQRAQHGDEGAFMSLAVAMGDRLHAVAHRILRDTDLAEDATQQALLAIWRDLPQLRDPGRFVEQPKGVMVLQGVALSPARGAQGEAQR